MNAVKFVLLSTLLFVGCDQHKVSPLENADHSPILLAIKSMGDRFQNELTNLTISQYVQGESPTSAIVEIEEQGFFDDPIAAEKTIFTLYNKEGKWIIDNQ